MLQQNAEIVYSVLLLVFLLSSFIVSRRYKNIPVVRYSLYWVGIFCLCGVLYLFKNSFDSLKNRFMAELVPGHAVEEGGELVVKRADNGHFYLYVTLNDKQVKFMVDTGASGVVISKNLAHEIGININNLQFTNMAYTANGIVETASAVVKKIGLSDFKLSNFRVDVSAYNEATPLLGMSFLSKLKSYKFQEDNLYLRY